MTRLAFALLALTMGCTITDPPPPPVTTTTTQPPACYAPIPRPGWNEDYAARPWRPAVHLWDVIEARDALQLGDCVLGAEQVRLELLAAELRAHEFCASALEDKVLVWRGNEDGEDLYEEYHAVAYTTGCWTKYPYKGVLAWVPAKGE